MKNTLLAIAILLFGQFASPIPIHAVSPDISAKKYPQAQFSVRDDAFGLNTFGRQINRIIVPVGFSTFDTINGNLSLIPSNTFTVANASTMSVSYRGTSANPVAVITLTRFALPPLKAAGGVQGNGNLLLTLPAGTQELSAGIFSDLKMFAANGAAAIKSNGTVLGIGSVKAGGAVKVLSGTATFQNILTGQQVQPNGRTLNAIAVTDYGTAKGGVKSVYLNYANGYPAVTNGTIYVNGTVAFPMNMI